MRVLLVTPPMTQLNTPYPATAYLTGFLRAHAADLDLTVTQADASLELFLRLFSAPLVARMAEVLERRARARGARHTPTPPSIAQFLAHAPRYVATVMPAIRFLQGRDPSLALRIVGREFLPEGPRFAQLRDAGRRRPARLGVRQPRHDRSSALSREPVRRRSRRRLARSASTRSSSSRATARSSPPARRRSSRSRRRSTASRRSSTKRSRSSRASSSRRIDPTSSACPRRSPATSTAHFAMAKTIRDAAPSREARARRRLGQHRAARAARAARVRLLRLRDARRRRAAALESAWRACNGKRAPLVRTYVRRDDAVVLETDATQPDFAQRDTGIPTYDGLPLARLRLGDGDAEPDASALVRRPLEQDHARARLLLEEVQLLRRVARLHRPLRPARRRRRARAHPRADRGDRPDRLPSRRRSRAAGRHARAREAPARREAEHHVVGQHPLRENLHAGALRPARRSGLRRRQRRARGRLRPAARR